MGTKRTKLAPISSELSKWPDVSQICAPQGAGKKLRPSTRPMQFVLASRSSCCSFLIPKLGAREGPSRSGRLSGASTPRATSPLCYPHPRRRSAVCGIRIADPEVRRKCEIAYARTVHRKSPPRDFLRARKPANTAARRSMRSTCCSDDTARISCSFGCFCGCRY
jgi:hypothetical protein